MDEIQNRPVSEPFQGSAEPSGPGTGLSEIVSLARQVQHEINAWMPALISDGELDQERFDRMVALRQQIIQSVPQDDMDRLMVLGSIRTAASFIFIALEGDVEDPAATLPAIRDGLAEILLGLNAIRPKLEKDAGATLEDLGLFVDGKVLQ